MIRQLTSPPTTAGSASIFPAQPAAFRVLSIYAEGYNCGVGLVRPVVFWQYGGVQVVAFAMPNNDIAPGSIANVGWSPDASEVGYTLGTSVYLQTHLPDIVITNQMSISVNWINADVGDFCGPISWLIDDEPFSRSR